MMSNAMHFYDNVFTPPYKKRDEHRPCSVWTRANQDNYAWHIRYFHEVCKEYTCRFGKTHKSYSHYKTFQDFWKAGTLKAGIVPAQPINATTHHKHIPDTYEAYRLCLTDKWANDKRPPKWTKRRRPEFFDGGKS